MSPPYLSLRRGALLGAATLAGLTLAKLALHDNDGITMQDHAGKLVYANQAAARVIGFPSAQALLDAPLSTVMKRFELFDAEGAPFPLERLPNRALFVGGNPEETRVG